MWICGCVIWNRHIPCPHVKWNWKGSRDFLDFYIFFSMREGGLDHWKQLEQNGKEGKPVEGDYDNPVFWYDIDSLLHLKLPVVTNHAQFCTSGFHLLSPKREEMAWFCTCGYVDMKLTEMRRYFKFLYLILMREEGAIGSLEAAGINEMECEPVEGGYNDSVPELKSQARQPFRKRRHSMCKLRERLNPALACDSALVRVQCSQSLANVRPAPHLATQRNQMQMPIPLSTQMSTQYQMQMQMRNPCLYTHNPRVPQFPTHLHNPETYRARDFVHCWWRYMWNRAFPSNFAIHALRCELRCLSWMEKRESGAANGYGRWSLLTLIVRVRIWRWRKSNGEALKSRPSVDWRRRERRVDLATNLIHVQCSAMTLSNWSEIE